MSADGLRLDKWLWHARFYRSRTLATSACQSRRIRINGVPIGKSHHPVKPGDILTFPHGSHIRIVRVLALGARRGPAAEARLLYEDLTSPAAPGSDDERRPKQDQRDEPRPPEAEASTSDPPRDGDADDPWHRPAQHRQRRKNPRQGVVEPPATDMLPISMFERLLAFFETGKTAGPDDTGASPLQRAAAVLLAMAARLDGHMAGNERDSIVRLLRTRLGVEDAEALVEEADDEAGASTDFYQVTRIIKDSLAADQRADVIEMLWEVAYADGEVHDYEANLVRRVAGLLHVEDRDAGEARKRVVERSQPSVSRLPTRMDERRQR